MDDSTLTYIIAPILSAALGGAAWLVKHFFEKKDEEQKRIFAQRDEDKQAIKESIKELKAEVKETREEVSELVGMIAGCEKPDCPNRARLREKLSHREGR